MHDVNTSSVNGAGPLGGGATTTIYEIKNPAGEVVAEKERTDHPDGTKDFKLRQPGSWGLNGTKSENLPLYGVHELNDEAVLTVVVEGEKTRDALAKALEGTGVSVVSPVTGAGGTPSVKTLEDLRGHEVTLWPDTDETGREHMDRIAERLRGIASKVSIYTWHDAPEVWVAGKDGGSKLKAQDAADHPAVKSGDEKEIGKLLNDLCCAPEWEPPKKRSATGGRGSGEQSLNGHYPTTFDPKDDRGLTAALADAILAAGHHFARDAGGKLYAYEGGVYQPDGERTIAREIKRILNETEASAKWTTHRAREITEYIRVDAPELWEHPPLETINVRNGLLDVETGNLKAHSPEFLSPVQLPVEFDKKARCSEWDRFAADTFPEDAQELAFEIPASLMVPNPTIQKAVLAIGEGANGKSTYLAAVEAFVGTENCVAVSLHKLETDRFAASRLVGKLANICPDLPSNDLVSTSIFKAVVGGDRITCEYKFRDSFDVRPFARLVFSANHPPESGDASYAFYRRWVVVPFNRTFEGGEQRPREELDAALSNPRELSGVLNKALAALKGLRERGGFTAPKSTREALDEFRQTTDPLSVWLDRNTIEHPDAMIAQDELRNKYNEFCQQTGKPGSTPQSFGRALARAKPGIQKAQRTWRGASNTRVYLGIGLRTEGQEGGGEEHSEQRDQRDQRIDTNCFPSRSNQSVKNNSDQRVDHVVGVDNTAADDAGDPLAAFLDNPSDWFVDQAERCAQDGALLKPLASAVAADVLGDALRGGEVAPAVEEYVRGRAKRDLDDVGVL